jgi:hypothetical protein
VIPRVNNKKRPIQTLFLSLVNTARHAMCPYMLIRFPSSGQFKTLARLNVEQEVETTGDDAGETLKNDKLRVAWQGMNNTHVCRTNTANRAPNMPMLYGHVPVRVCSISILWNFHTNPCQSTETTS